MSDEVAHVDLDPRTEPAIAGISLLYLYQTHSGGSPGPMAPGHHTHLQCAHRNHHTSWTKAGACLLWKGRECMLGLRPSIPLLTRTKPEPSPASEASLLGPVPAAKAPEQAGTESLMHSWFALGQRCLKREAEAELCVSRLQTEGPRTLKEGSVPTT